MKKKGVKFKIDTLKQEEKLKEIQSQENSYPVTVISEGKILKESFNAHSTHLQPLSNNRKSLLFLYVHTLLYIQKLQLLQLCFLLLTF